MRIDSTSKLIAVVVLLFSCSSTAWQLVDTNAELTKKAPTV